MLNGRDVLTELTKEKNKISKPILSEEQKILLENKIIEYFFQKEEVKILYYEAGYQKSLTGVITKLDPVKKKIYLNNKISLHFSNILDILTKNA
ncbi:MAG: YolD-like family protein [Bacilli bacterium]|nr:YolD-like family protein [Bacilli bacterium]